MLLKVIICKFFMIFYKISSLIFTCGLQIAVHSFFQRTWYHLKQPCQKWTYKIDINNIEYIKLYFTFIQCYRYWWWFGHVMISNLQTGPNFQSRILKLFISGGEISLRPLLPVAIKNNLRTIWSPYKMIAYIMNFMHNDRLRTVQDDIQTVKIDIQ